MSQSKHSKGPWTVEKDLSHEGYLEAFNIVHADGKYVVGPEGIYPVASEMVEAAANARLIAAAPELLEALRGFNLKPEAIVSSQGDTITLRLPIKAIQDAAAAVAKAEGTTP